MLVVPYNLRKRLALSGSLKEAAMSRLDKPYQTRSETTGLNGFDTLKEAHEAAANDETIWKISFWDDGQRVRLVRQPNGKFEESWLGDG